VIQYTDLYQLYLRRQEIMFAVNGLLTFYGYDVVWLISYKLKFQEKKCP